MDHGASSYLRYLGGDDEGLVEIIRDHKNGLILYLNGYVRNLMTAEELAEDTFYKIAIKKPAYHAKKASFKTWLYAIGRNVAIDALRRKRIHTDAVSDTDPDLTGDTQDPENIFFQTERDRILHRVLYRLEPNYRQVLYLSYFEELSQAEIAQILHKSVHAVQTLAYRARRACRQELEKEGLTCEELS